MVATSRWCSRSTLLPTRRRGTLSVPLTLVIWKKKKAHSTLAYVYNYILCENIYLLPHGFDVLESLVVGDGVDNDKALAITDVKVSH